MKKLTAMLLSLVMCLSLLVIPAQAASEPDPPGPGVSDTDRPTGPSDSGNKDPEDPGDKDPENPGGMEPDKHLPGDRDEVPMCD